MTWIANTWAVIESREAHVTAEHVPLALTEINVNYLPILNASKAVELEKNTEENNWEF